MLLVANVPNRKNLEEQVYSQYLILLLRYITNLFKILCHKCGQQNY